MAQRGTLGTKSVAPVPYENELLEQEWAQAVVQRNCSLNHVNLRKMFNALSRACVLVLLVLFLLVFWVFWRFFFIIIFIWGQGLWYPS